MITDNAELRDKMGNSVFALETNLATLESRLKRGDLRFEEIIADMFKSIEKMKDYCKEEEVE